MRQSVPSVRSSKFSQAAAIALLSATVAGCSTDVSRFGDGPVYTGSTDNQRSIFGGGPAAAPSGDLTGSIGGGGAPAPVQRTYLPPPAAAPAQSYAPPAAPVDQPPRIAAQPTYAPTLAAPAPTPAPGWQPGANTVVLQPGESIDSLSRKYGVPVGAILQANNFADAARVPPGTRVVIPTYSMPAAAASVPAAPKPAAPPVAAAPKPAAVPPRAAAAAPPAPPPAPAVAVTGAKVGPHVVKPGENLERIANSYGITKAKLMQANNLKSDAIRPGQKLTLPSGAVLRVAAPAPAAPAPAPVAAAQPAKPLEAARAPAPAAVPARPAETKVAALGTQPVAPAETVAVAKEPPPEAESSRGEAKSGTPSFRWPVRGRVIKDFGSANGERNDGINLAVPEGTSIKAAEDGEVIYSGNELKGYGNLVLVRHQDGWVTAYAHASELLVSRGEKITRGQIIARAGATGGVSQPQLHFEIRKGQRPVDPKQFLASN